MKCQSCRIKDVELLTYRERLRNWLLYKLFSQDVADVSQGKYTQGFSDGYVIGRKHQKENYELNKELYS